MSQYKASDFIGAIKGSGGIISTIATRVGCTWVTAKKWIDEYPTVQSAYQDECERVNDMAQGILMKSIQDGNTQDAKWWLARKRRKEFGANIDVTSGGKPIDFTKYTDEELSSMRDGKYDGSDLD